MGYFQVLEDGEGIEKTILQGLANRAVYPRQCSREHPALLVVSPKTASKGAAVPRACRTVLLPGSGGNILSGLRAASAVSYGPSPRDSLTISSREKEQTWVALQREIVTLEGRVVERQEFPVPLAEGNDEMPVLAAVGALLLLGILPEDIGPAVWNQER